MLHSEYVRDSIIRYVVRLVRFPTGPVKTRNQRENEETNPLSLRNLRRIRISVFLGFRVQRVKQDPITKTPLSVRLLPGCIS